MGIGNVLLRHWYQFMGLSRHTPPSWYRDRLLEEIEEYLTADKRIARLSEASDVLFVTIRAQYDGHPVQDLIPPSPPRHGLIYAYMVLKFTLRWSFYRTAAFLCRVPHHSSVREVVNPTKDEKLEEVASRHGIDPAKFKKTCRRLRRVFPLLP